MPRFTDLSAVLLNRPLSHDGDRSHTRSLPARAGGVMRAEGVDVDLIHVLDHQIGVGMVNDTTELGDSHDDGPGIHARIMAAATVGGNVAASWRDGTNAADQDPEATF